MRDPRTAMRGSMMTRAGSVRWTVLIKVRKCSEMVKGDRKVSPVLWLVLLTTLRRWMRDGSPPAASTRGLMVRAASSSGRSRRRFPAHRVCHRAWVCPW